MVENREFVDNIEARAGGADTNGDVVSEPVMPRGDVIEGMDVMSSDNEALGKVREARATHFLLDRPMARDVWVPNNAIADVNSDRVYLSVASVDDHGWENPPLMSDIVV
jgi:hypothetical protein